MSKKNIQEPEVELGILQNYGDEDEFLISEKVFPEQTLSTGKAIITRVGNGEIWIILNGFGYIITTEEIEPWMTKGTTASVIYEGTPGKADFKIAGVEE